MISILDISPLIISLKVSLIATLIAFVFGTLIAINMYFYKGKLKNTFDTLINLPIVLPPVAVGFFLLYMFGKKSFFGLFLNRFNINIIFSWQAAVISATVVTFPLMYRSIIVSLSHIDNELIEVGKTLGASKLQTAYYILFPLSKNGIVTGMLVCFMRSMGEFGATLMIAGNIPGKTQTIPSAIYFYASNGDFKTAFIWVLIIIIVSFLFTTIINLFSKTN